MNDKPTKEDDAHAILTKMQKHDVEQPGDTPTDTIGSNQPSKGETEEVSGKTN